jgi:hypothetical protein
MSDIHDLVLRHGRDAARDMVVTKHEKLAVDMAAEILAEESRNMGVTHAGFCITALPHRRIADDVWRKEGFRVTLLVESGRDRQGTPIGIPYGPKARVLLLYLQTRAIQTNSRTIEMGDSMYEWLGRVGIGVGGNQYREVREQTRRLATCHLTFIEETEVMERRRNGAFVENAVILKTDARQGSLWQDTIELNPAFFDALKAHPVPLWESALRQIAANSMAIDLYTWLAYRLQSLEDATPISWPSLHGQFGTGFAALKHFKPEFKRNLTYAMAVYPEARIEETARGFVLHPSRPPVARRLAAG